MAGNQQVYRLTAVPKEHAEAAYAFHESSGGTFVWPRSLQYIRDLAADGCLFAAWNADGDPVGLAYAEKLEEDVESWEIGGLTVERNARKHGLGTVLLRFALANVFVYHYKHLPYPFPRIIAHVLASNKRPRHILPELGFEWRGSVEKPRGTVPATFPRDADGLVRGDVFVYTPRGLIDLSKWFDDFDGTLLGNCRCEFDLGLSSLLLIQGALRALVAELP
ncbi:MAG TPA: GNAT family N-acetyltransferase [Thermoanaerobaculia bacterium]|nr:GNAT family N-acetyltransferase [Thermoanaerobaculia bacterium]